MHYHQPPPLTSEFACGFWSSQCLPSTSNQSIRSALLRCSGRMDKMSCSLTCSENTVPSRSPLYDKPTFRPLRSHVKHKHTQSLFAPAYLEHHLLIFRRAWKKSHFWESRKRWEIFKTVTYIEWMTFPCLNRPLTPCDTITSRDGSTHACIHPSHDQDDCPSI